METVRFSSQFKNDFLLLPGFFIDFYLAKANGEYVKVYLYLLRAASLQRPLSVAQMAEDLDHTQRDIVRALTYWDRENLLRLGFNARQEITDIVLLSPDAPGSKEESTRPEQTSFAEDFQAAAGSGFSESSAKPSADCPADAPSGVSGDVSPDSVPAESPRSQRVASVEDLAQDESFSELCFLAQTYTKKTLTSRDTERIGYWYILYDCSYDIIEYLLEYCVEMGHPNINYMEKVVLSWHESGLRTVEEIKEHSRKYSNIAYKVMRAFGIGDRSPSPKESQLIQKWSQDYGFSADMIETACERTLAAIQKPSFAYADSILTAWKKHGCRTKEDLASYDASHQKSRQKQTPQNSSGNRSQSRSNKFHNFEQRSTDYNKMVADFYGYQDS